MVALKLIQEIKKAEDKAREMIKDAESEAEIALDEARRSAADEIDNQRKASIRMERETIQGATEEAQGEIERLRERARKYLAHIRDMGRENIDEAVKRIMEGM